MLNDSENGGNPIDSMSQANDWLNLMQGTFRKKRFKVIPNYWEQETFIGQDKNLKYYSRIKLSVKQPNPQYPEIGFRFQLYNASGSCFATLKTVDEIDFIIEWLKKQKKEMIQVNTELLPYASEALAKYREWEKAQEQIDNLQRMQGLNKED